jgi:GTPase SAR1 family protein
MADVVSSFSDKNSSVLENASVSTIEADTTELGEQHQPVANSTANLSSPYDQNKSFNSTRSSTNNLRRHIDYTEDLPLQQSSTRMPQYPPRRKTKGLIDSFANKQIHATNASRSIIEQLKDLYKIKVKPIEQAFGLYNFCLPTNAELHDSEFDAKPMVLLIGQYSTGKTTFIRHLVGGDYPSMHIGPEPTTDKFTALIHGINDDDDDDHDDEYDIDEDGYTDRENDASSTVDESVHDDTTSMSVKTNPKNVLSKRWKNDGVNKSSGRTVKGNSLTVMPELPFSSLSTFGSGFLSHFVGSITDAPLLEHVTLIDTPGVLSGEKQRISRSYDFAKASRWFADRSDLILLLFDAHKLDISDELKEVIETIRPHNDDKIRCVLNKADGVTREQLVRVYGSLMWSMGKIFKSPEVVRVYTGSYWDEPLVHDDFRHMFDSDEYLLVNELINLPKSYAERKVNEVVKRIRIIKVHICILTYLRKQMPRWFGKKRVQEALIENLEQIFDVVRVAHNLSAGDFPDLEDFRNCLFEVEDFSSFMIADKKTLRRLDELVSTYIPNIMKGSSGISTPNTPKKTPMKSRTNKHPLKRLDEDYDSEGEEINGPMMKVSLLAAILGYF